MSTGWLTLFCFAILSGPDPVSHPRTQTFPAALSCLRAPAGGPCKESGRKHGQPERDALADDDRDEASQFGQKAKAPRGGAFDPDALFAEAHPLLKETAGAPRAPVVPPIYAFCILLI